MQKQQNGKQQQELRRNNSTTKTIIASYAVILYSAITMMTFYFSIYVYSCYELRIHNYSTPTT